MTRVIEHYESPHVALWKSCAAQVVAETLGAGDPTTEVDSAHPIILATDRHCRAMMSNQPLHPPPADSEDEAAVAAYLSFLYHRKAHARLDDDAELEADLDRQTKEFTFGNPLWQQMFEQYLQYYWQYPSHAGGQPRYRSWQAPEHGAGDLDYAIVDWRLPDDARVAIVGDIGTGTDEAAAVLVAALSFEPHAIVHLGDVYFSGTDFEMEHRLVGMVERVRRSTGSEVPFFTVPGNHEYFTGAGPYLRTLDAGRLTVQPSRRQVASYFCLRTEDDGWQFLGLDTGYQGHYMNVPPAARQAALEHLHVAGAAVSDPTAALDQVRVREDELAWHLDKMSGFAGRTVLLSHHQLYSALQVCGTAQSLLGGDASGQPTADRTRVDPADYDREWVNTGLWRQFGPCFGDQVSAWIWGHEHNLLIFEDNYRPADWPVDTPEATDTFKALPKGRCAGHSAIPVAQSEGPYQRKYPVPTVSSDVQLGLTDGWYNHGFQIMRLDGRGNPAELTYYQVAGADPTPEQIYTEQVC